MALVVFSLVMLAIVGVSDGTWCVCKPEASNSQQQKTIDYACGAGADCAPIHETGACYNPNTVLAHCSYAANSFFQRNNQDQQACNFESSAQIVTSDPSTAGCTYPATPSAAGTSGTTSSTTGTPGTGSNSFSSNSSTGTTTSSPGMTGLGPTGTDFDSNNAPVALFPVPKMASFIPFLLGALLFS